MKYPMQPEKDGKSCPHCGQFVKLYRRKLNSGMAASLYWMVEFRKPGQWIEPAAEAPRFVLRGRDWGKLEHWGLIERRQDHPGWWRVTVAGELFAKGHSVVKSHVDMFDNRVFGFSGDDVNITHCLAEDFDFQELMNA